MKFLPKRLFLYACFLALYVLPFLGQAQVTVVPYSGLHARGERGEQVLITGAIQHPTPSALQNLWLAPLISKEQENRFRMKKKIYKIHQSKGVRGWEQFVRISPDSLRGRKVLSLGEGHSCLVPYLQSRGIKAKGLDLWYHLDTSFPASALSDKELMSLYRKKFQNPAENRNFLIIGDATDLTKIQIRTERPDIYEVRESRIEDETYEMVVSHYLFNDLFSDSNGRSMDNIENQSAFLMLSESMRVLNFGGTIRFNYAKKLLDRSLRTKIFQTLRNRGYEFDYVLLEGETSISVTRNTQVMDFLECFSKQELDEQLLSELDEHWEFIKKSKRYQPLTQKQVILILKKLKP